MSNIMILFECMVYRKKEVKFIINDGILFYCVNNFCEQIDTVTKDNIVMVYFIDSKLV